LLSSGSAGDPEVVPARIEDPEVRQAPWAVLEIVFERPSCRSDPIALAGDIVHFKNQIHSRRRSPPG
jgi:hypothetical protein